MDPNKPFIPVTLEPNEIEAESFRIIDSEIGKHDFSPLEYPIVQRIIHSTADFDLGKSLRFSPESVQKGILAIRSGKNIITDITMIQSGISKPRLEKYGCQVLTYISHPEVIEKAKKHNLTRSIMATRKAVAENPDGIYIIGNAPTALLELIRLVKEGQAKPSLIIGLPVGFVSAAESKAELMQVNVPYITNVGRKGGTPAAVAAFNALSILATRKTTA